MSESKVSAPKSRAAAVDLHALVAQLPTLPVEDAKQHAATIKAAALAASAAEAAAVQARVLSHDALARVILMNGNKPVTIDLGTGDGPKPYIARLHRDIGEDNADAKAKPGAYFLSEWRERKPRGADNTRALL